MIGRVQLKGQLQQQSYMLTLTMVDAKHIVPNAGIRSNNTAHMLEPVEKDIRPRLASSQTRACMPCIRCTCVCRDNKPQVTPSIDWRPEHPFLRDARQELDRGVR